MSDIVNHKEAMENEITERFSFHPGTDVTGPLHDAVRQQHLNLAFWLLEILPESREQSLALTALQESMMWSNAAIAYRNKTE